MDGDWQEVLSLFKPIMLELQGAAVLIDGANSALVKALRPPGADLDRDLNLTADLAGQSLDDFFHN